MKLAFLDYVWLVPALPLLAFVLILFLGHRTPEKGGWIALALVGGAGVLSLLVFWDAVHLDLAADPYVRSVEWWSAGGYDLGFGVYVDNLTVFLLAIVGVLVTLIVAYSIGYMHEEGRNRRRYFAEMCLFIGGMFGLVVADNFLELFIFWEIMGLCSYLLIGYWFQKPSAAAAAKKAFLVTRIGDIFLFAGLVILLVTFGTLDYERLFEVQATGRDLTLLGLANLFIFLGAVGKSAQFPLHVWLPDAMEGPTTVSALIHAATMVKAGVFLVARAYPLMVQTPWVLVVVAVVGGFTAVFTATMALTNWDLKRVMAYSTLSQLGYMFLGLGVGGALYFHGASVETLALAGFTWAMFHLMAHAFFKALLFLSAGSVGHAVGHYDMRRMGGLHRHMKVTSFGMLFGALALAGIFPFAGFFSKDELLAAVLHAADASALYLVLYGVGLLTAFLTAFYMFRAWFLTFLGDYRGPGEGHVPAPTPGGSPATIHGHGGGHEHGAHEDDGPPPGVPHHGAVHLHESGPWMAVPLVVLSVFALAGGFYLFTHLPMPHAPGLDDPHLPSFVYIMTAPTTWVSLAVAAAGIALAWFMFQPAKAPEAVMAEDVGWRRVLNRRYYVDDAYDYVGGTLVDRFAGVLKWFDENVIDGIVNGSAWVSRRTGEWGRRMQSGNVQDYATVVLAGALLLIMLVIYVPSLLRFLAERGAGVALGGGP